MCTVFSLVIIPTKLNLNTYSDSLPLVNDSGTMRALVKNVRFFLNPKIFYFILKIFSDNCWIPKYIQLDFH